MKLEWRGDNQKSVRVEEPLAQIIAGEGKFDGELSRVGHGLQRCYLLALLQELSGNDDTSGPRLILGVEEPELHQHPPQARHLADVLVKLSTLNSQIIVSTHSPFFVNGERVQDVRLIRKDGTTSAVAVTYVTLEQLAQTIGAAKKETPAIPTAMELKMQQALLPSLNEIFFSRVVVLVEGLEDVAYLTCYLNLLELWEEFRRYGCHIVSADRKSNILNPLAIAKHLQIPVFVVFDSDGHKALNNSGNRAKHEKDNLAILRLRGYDTQPAFPADTFWSGDTVMWKSEVGEIVKEEMAEKRHAILEQTRAQFGQEGDLEKTALFVAAYLTKAWSAGVKSPSLEKACKLVIAYAKNPAVATKTLANPKPPEEKTASYAPAQAKEAQKVTPN